MSFAGGLNTGGGGSGTVTGASNEGLGAEWFDSANSTASNLVFKSLIASVDFNLVENPTDVSLSINGGPLGTLAFQDGTFSGTSSGTNTGDQDLSGLALKSTTISAGTGMSGGGDLSANRTLNCTITQYTDELAQDATGAMATNSTFVNLTYNDGVPSLTPALSATGTPDNTTFLRGDNTWSTPSSGAPTDAQYVTLTTNGTLTNERVLTAGYDQSLVDAGAGSTITISGSHTLAAPSASTYTITSSDRGTVIRLASGVTTVTTDPAATLGNGFYCWLENNTTTNITINPNASETINGNTTMTLARGEPGLFLCDGSNFRFLANTMSTNTTAGFITKSGAAYASRTLTGTANQIDITNGTGGGNPVFSIPYNAKLGSSSAGPSSLDFFEDADNGSSKITVTVGSSLSADTTFTIPNTTGTAALTLDTPFPVGGISNNWYASGSIMGGQGNSNTAINHTTGTLWFSPFFLSKTTTFTKIGILCGGTAAGTSVLGIYNDSGNAAPTGSPVANSNSTSITNTATTFITYTFSSAITLTPGLYWLAHSTSATTNFISPTSGGYDIGGRGLGNSATPTTSNLNTPQCGWSQSFTYSATLPSVGSLAAVQSFTAGDAFKFLQAQ